MHKNLCMCVCTCAIENPTELKELEILVHIFLCAFLMALVKV